MIRSYGLIFLIKQIMNIILGDIHNETFFVKKIIQKPYSSYCNYIKMNYKLYSHISYNMIHII
jgi:hypothetical protein